MRLTSGFGDYLLALCVLVAMDVALFHRGAYFPLLQPDSYSGHVEQSSRRFQVMLAERPGWLGVVVMGDSTAGSGIQEVPLEAILGSGAGEMFAINLAQGGSTPRSWYSLLEDDRIRAERVPLVVLGIQPGALRFFPDPKPDLAIIKTRLRVRDGVTLARSYHDSETRSEAFFTSLFRAPLFKEDLTDYLGDPVARQRSVAEECAWEAGFSNGWRRENLADWDLTSAQLDRNGNLDEEALDPRLRDNSTLKASLERVLRRAQRPTRAIKNDIDPANEQLVARLVGSLNRRGVDVVVAVLPRSPYPLPYRDLDDLEGLVTRLQADGARLALYHDVDLLETLEDPRYFKDLLHLNRLGATTFTEKLAAFVNTRLE